MHRTHLLSNSPSSRPHSDSQIPVIYVRAMLVRFVSSFKILEVIPLLHNCENMYLPLTCLLIKILLCIYYLFTIDSSKNRKFCGINFRDFTIGSEFRGIYFRRSLGFRGQTVKISARKNLRP